MGGFPHTANVKSPVVPVQPSYAAIRVSWTPPLLLAAVETTRPDELSPLLDRRGAPVRATAVELASTNVSAESADPTWEAVVSFGPVPFVPEEIALSVDVGHGARLTPCHHDQDSAEVTWHRRRIYRSDEQLGREHGVVQIGTVDYESCRACRLVRLGEIGLVDDEQRHGIGSRVLAQLRTELPEYRWCTTLTKTRSEGFWRRMQAWYPGEYHSTGDKRRRICTHLASAVD